MEGLDSSIRLVNCPSFSGNCPSSSPIWFPRELLPLSLRSWLMGLGMGIWEFVFRTENQGSLREFKLSQAAEAVKSS